MARDIRLARLFFELETDTKGFKKDIADAEKSAGRLATFIKANPIPALGALGAAAVAAGIKAAEMAAEFDTSVRRIAAVVPGATARLEDLRRTADRLSIAKGLSSDEVLAGLQAIGKEGVTSIEALDARFTSLQRAADATGTTVGDLAGPFDQILDVFGLTDAELERVAATLAKLSQDRGVGFLDLLQGFQTAAPTIRAAGLSFDEGAAAISRLLSQGLSAKQVAAQLKDEVEKLGNDGMRKLASETVDSNEALREFAERAAVVEGGADRLSGRIAALRDQKIRGVGRAIKDELLDPLLNLSLVLTDPDIRRAFLGGGVSGAAAAIASKAAASIPSPLPPGTVQDPVTGDLVLTGTGRRGKPTGPTDEQIRKARGFASEVADATAKATQTLVDDLELTLTRFKARFREALDGLSATERKQAEAQIADLERRLAAIRQAEQTVLVPQIQRTTEAPLKIRKDTEGLADAAKAAADQAARFKREQEEADRRIQQARIRVRQQADAIERAARATIQLARGFGLIDENAAQAAAGIAQIAAEIKVVSANGFSFGSALTIAGGVAQLFGGLFGGKSAAELRFEALQERNTEAIERLAKVIGEWELQITGSQFTGAQAGVNALLGNPGAFFGLGFTDVDLGDVRRVLRGVGTSLSDLKDVAKELGIELDTSNAARFIASLQKLQEALAETQLTQFATTFAGQLELLGQRFQLFDITDPIAQLTALANLAKQFSNSSALTGALAGLDLTDPTQRAEAERRVRDLFNRFASGQLTPAELGGLTPQEFLDFLQRFQDLIDQAQQGTTTGGPIQETFGVIRNITDTQADKLISLGVGQLSTLTEIRDLLAGVLAFAPVSAPGLPATGLAGGNLVIEGDVVVHLGDGASAAEAQAAGAAVVQGITEEADRQFGLRLSTKRSRFGNVVVR